ncbi:MAG: alpha/beta hydrolase, partial [Cyanobacteria bacterium P01_A01_bin.68]
MASSLNLSLFRRKRLLTFLVFITISYSSFSIYLYLQQRYLIFRPQLELQILPTASDFNLPYAKVTIPITNSKNESLSGWWF